MTPTDKPMDRVGGGFSVYVRNTATSRANYYDLGTWRNTYLARVIDEAVAEIAEANREK